MARASRRACLALATVAPLPVFATDFRTLNHTFVADFPSTAAGDSTLRHPSGRGPFKNQDATHGLLFESGLISSPTTFSFDLPYGVRGVTTHPHPSFFLSPGVSVGYRHGEAIEALKFIYFGAFDFYFGVLESGPVYSRLQHPVFVYEHRHRLPFSIVQGLTGRFGVLHESNGMFVESAEQFAAMQNVLPAGYDAQDFASMGWNAWLLEAQGDLRMGRYVCRPHLGLKLYTQEDGFWRFSGLEDTSLFYLSGQGAGRGVGEADGGAGRRHHIWDYDGLIAMLTLEVPGDFFFLRLWPLHYFPWTRGWVSVGLQTGGVQAGGLSRMLEHGSYHIALKGRWYQLPWIGFLKYAYGYTQPIAYYTLPSHQFSLGIEFANFKFGS